MSDVFDEPDAAATPLTDEEKRDLLPAHIAYRRELNAAEQENIVRALAWLQRRRGRNLLDEGFIKGLHRQMFCDVWRWAGRFRTTARNIGVEHWRIAVELRVLLDDVRTWIANNVYGPDEIAVRTHHRLVQIHPFPNGNGRFARLFADLLVERLGQPAFSWGRSSLIAAGDLRRQYIAALRAADNHDIAPLLAFARS